MSVTQKSSGRRWLWFIPGALLIAALLVSFPCWQYFKTTPSYSLALLIDAAQRTDQAAFDRVVDLDRVIDDFITQSAPGSTLGLTSGLVSSVRTQLQTLAPETIASVKEGVKEDILSRINELAGSTRGRPFVVTALVMPFVNEINQTGDSAQVKVNRTGEVELLMERREGSDWRVTSLRDQALATRVVSGIVKNLPESELDQQLRRELRGLPEMLQKFPLLNGK